MRKKAVRENKSKTNPNKRVKNSSLLKKRHFFLRLRYGGKKQHIPFLVVLVKQLKQMWQNGG
jgi:hypothetical protein